MNTDRLLKGWLALCCACMLILSPGAYAADGKQSEGVAQANESVEKDVQAKTEDKTAERRQKIIQEAVAALAKTKDALQALEENRTDDALEALALTTGKLELIVAREPALSLAPTDLAVTTHDLYASPEAIRDAVKRAKKALDDGRVQEARYILQGMGSEVVLTVTNLPLATYPDAIKAIIPLIDDGEIDRAKRALQAALNTVVLTEQVLPLPVIRSEALLARAEELAEKADRTDEENQELADSLTAARGQLKMGELLGYGGKGEYKPLYAQLDQIEENTEDGKSGKGFFDRLKSSMSSLWESIAS